MPPQPESHGHDEHHAHHPRQGHHWDSMKQQFEAGKLGMWLFLATEVLLFGGLFCAYAVWRGNHPELFKFGSQYLDTFWGATNTAVLILSSLTMAWGVTCAQKNQQTGLKICLVLTLAGAVTFMVIKYFEYTHKFHEGWFPGIKFYEEPGEHSHTYERVGTTHGSVAELVPGDTPPPPTHAEEAAAEHAADAPSGETVAQSEFELQTVGVSVKGQLPTPPVEASTVAPAAIGTPGMIVHPILGEEVFHFERPEHEAIKHPLQDPQRPANAHMFFNIYFMMTGLHGIHVLVGMIVITWLLVRTFKGHFNHTYFTPIDLGGLYWHVVDLIWILLVPLFYLI
jgi:cytochrome c oxidase subunit 3